VDTFCSPRKQFALLDLAISIYELGVTLIELGAPVQELQRLPLLTKARRCKSLYANDQLEQIAEFREEVERELEAVRLEYAKQGVQAP